MLLFKRFPANWLIALQGLLILLSFLPLCLMEQAPPPPEPTPEQENSAQRVEEPTKLNL